MLADHIKKRDTKEIKDHFVDKLHGLIKSTQEIIEVYDNYDIIRSTVTKPR